MFGLLGARKKKAKGEGEKPFWISYADLMTAMMTLFLAAMAATMVAISSERAREKSLGEKRDDAIRSICSQLKVGLGGHTSIEIDCEDHRIRFGEVGRFAQNDYRLPPEANQVLAELVPKVLATADSEEGKRWLKQVVIEGFTDTDGSYLYNLHLSLQRSQWVMCLLLDRRKNAALSLTEAQLQRVRQLFLAGGVSFNDAKESKDESRRVEMRLEFRPLEEQDNVPPPIDFASRDDDVCMLS
ncbi:MAG: OmpA family protein [Xanthomonadales bacterium]|nr:OmpA family protein [Xanthomonadales bacterium]